MYDFGFGCYDTSDEFMAYNTKQAINMFYEKYPKESYHISYYDMNIEIKNSNVNILSLINKYIIKAYNTNDEYLKTRYIKIARKLIKGVI